MKILNPAAKVLFVLATVCSLSLAIATAQQGTGQAPKVVRKSDGILAGSATRRVEPTYPPLAKAARVSGAVVVEITVDEEGKVIAARALSGHPLLKDEAVSAARGWAFAPTRLSGEAVKVIGTITFNFTLPEVEEELTKAKQAVEANPNSAEAQHALGQRYESNTRFDEAKTAYKKAIELRPDYQEAYIALAMLYGNLKQYDEEVSTYREALEAMPHSLSLMHNLARVLATSGEYDEAIEVYKTILTIEPQNWSTHFLIGKCYFQVKRYGDCIDSLLKALKGSDHSLAIELIGRAYFHVGDLEKAEQYLTEAAKSPFEPAVTQEYLGDIYQRQGKTELAIKAWQKALLSPEDGEQEKRLKAKINKN